MAQIDLRHATIEVKDGYSAAGAVNNVSGYSSSAVTILVDNFAGALAIGDVFTVAGETGTPKHTITAHIETSSNTTSITFTPAITSAIVDNAIITVLPHTLSVLIGEGNMEWTEKKNREYKLEKRRIAYVRDGDDEPTDVSLDFIWEFLTAESGDPPTIEDAIKRRNAAATWETSGADPCEPYCLDLVVTYTPPCGGSQKEVITLREFRYEELQHNLKDAQIAVKGKCKIAEPDVARVA